MPDSTPSVVHVTGGHEMTETLSVLVALNLCRPPMPWSVVEVNEENQTFLTLFKKLQAGCFIASSPGSCLEMRLDASMQCKCRTI